MERARPEMIWHSCPLRSVSTNGINQTQFGSGEVEQVEEVALEDYLPINYPRSCLGNILGSAN